MATPSSIPAWRIPCTEERGRLQAVGSQRVGHGWATYHAHELTIISVFHFWSQCDTFQKL